MRLDSDGSTVILEDDLELHQIDSSHVLPPVVRGELCDAVKLFS
jgi:hypothetical protein